MIKQDLLVNFNFYKNLFFKKKKLLRFKVHNIKLVKSLQFLIAKFKYSLISLDKFESILNRKYSEYRVINIDLGRLDFGCFSTVGLLLYVYYDTYHQCYRCVIDSGFKHFLYTDFSFFGTPYKVKQNLGLPSLFLRTSGIINGLFRGIDNKRGEINYNYDYNYNYFYSYVREDLFYFDFLKDLYFRDYVSIWTSKVKSNFSRNVVNILWIYLLRFGFLIFQGGAFEGNFLFDSNLVRSLYSIKFNVNNIVLGVSFWGFLWSKFYSLIYDNSVKVSSYQYKRDYIPIHFLSDVKRFRTFRKNIMLFFLQESLQSQIFLNYYYNQYYYDTDKIGARRGWLLGNKYKDKLEYDADDDEYFFGENHLYNLFLTDFFFTRDRFYPWLQVKTTEFLLNQRKFWDEQKVVSDELRSFLEIIMKVYFPIYGYLNTIKNFEIKDLRVYNVVRFLYNFKFYKKLFLNLKSLRDNLKFKVKRLGSEICYGYFSPIVKLKDLNLSSVSYNSVLTIIKLLYKLQKFNHFKFNKFFSRFVYANRYNKNSFLIKKNYNNFVNFINRENYKHNNRRDFRYLKRKLKSALKLKSFRRILKHAKFQLKHHRKSRILFGVKLPNIRFKALRFGKVRFVNWLFKQKMLIDRLYWKFKFCVCRDVVKWNLLFRKRKQVLFSILSSLLRCLKRIFEVVNRGMLKSLYKMRSVWYVFLLIYFRLNKWFVLMEDGFFLSWIRRGMLVFRFKEVFRISLIFLSSWLEVCRDSFNNSLDLTEMLDVFGLDRQFIVETYEDDQNDERENKKDNKMKNEEDNKNDKQNEHVKAHKRWLRETRKFYFPLLSFRHEAVFGNFKKRLVSYLDFDDYIKNNPQFLIMLSKTWYFFKYSVFRKVYNIGAPFFLPFSIVTRVKTREFSQGTINFFQKALEKVDSVQGERNFLLPWFNVMQDLNCQRQSFLTLNFYKKLLYKSHDNILNWMIFFRNLCAVNSLQMDSVKNMLIFIRNVLIFVNQYRNFIFFSFSKLFDIVKFFFSSKFKVYGNSTKWKFLKLSICFFVNNWLLRVKSKFNLLSSVINFFNQYLRKVFFHFSLINKFYFLSDMIRGMIYSRMTQDVNHNFYRVKGRSVYNNYRHLDKALKFMDISEIFVDENKFVSKVLSSKKWVPAESEDEDYQQSDKDVSLSAEFNKERILLNENGYTFVICKGKNGNVEVFPVEEEEIEKDEEEDKVKLLNVIDVNRKFKLIRDDWFIRRRAMRRRLCYVSSLDFMKKSRYFKSGSFFNKDVFKRRCQKLSKKLKYLIMRYGFLSRLSFIKSFKERLLLRVLALEKYFFNKKLTMRRGEINRFFLEPRILNFKRAFRIFYFNMKRHVKGRFKRRINLLWPYQRKFLSQSKFVSKTSNVVRNQLYYLYFYDFIINKIIKIFKIDVLNPGYNWMLLFYLVFILNRYFYNNKILNLYQWKKIVLRLKLIYFMLFKQDRVI